MSGSDIVEVGGQILDCPFCGSPGVIFMNGCNGQKEDGEPEILYGVQCVSCGMGYMGDGLPYDEALRVWNRRDKPSIAK